MENNNQNNELNENANVNANENTKKKSSEKNKALMFVLIFFAIIGFVCFMAAGIYGVVSLVGKVDAKKIAADSKNAQGMNTTDEKITITLDEKANADSNGQNAEGGASNAQADGNQLSGDLADAVAPDMSASIVDDDSVYDDGKLQIVFLGDSIIDNFRDQTGICGIVMQNLDATVYNLGIGGTTASVEVGASWEDEKWDYTCGAGVAKALAGFVDPDKLRDCTAKNIIKEHKDDFKKTDIFVIEYGVNDFMYGRTIVDNDKPTNLTTYSGAIRSIIASLQSVAPNAKIVLCQPSFVSFYRSNGEYVGNSYTLNNGPGTEMEYGGALYYIAETMGLYFFDFDSQGITVENCDEYLLDGVHLNDAGRAMYAENLTKYIKSHILDME